MTAALLATALATLLAACGGSSASHGGTAAHHAGPASRGSTATTGAAGATGTSGARTTHNATTTRSATAHPATTTQSATAHAASTHASSAEGLKVFTDAGCASCHTLAAAHATGTVGPNLDDLKPSEALVASQVANGGAVMPSFAGRLSRAEIAAVAKFVASAAG